MKPRSIWILKLALVAITATHTAVVLPPSHTSVVMAQTQEDRRARANELFLRGGEQVQENDLESAIASFQAALTISQALQDQEFIAYANGNLGSVYLAKGEYELAVDRLLTSLENLQIGQNLEFESFVLETLAEAYVALEQPEESIAYLERRLLVVQQLEDRIEESNVLGTIAIAYLSLQDYSNAIEFFNESLRVSREIGYDRNTEITLINLSKLYYETEDYAQAANYFDQFIQFHNTQNQIPISEMLLEAMLGLGNSYLRLDDYPASISAFFQAVPLAEQLQKFEDLVMTYNNLGYSYREVRDYDNAISSLEKGLALAREQQNSIEEINFLNNLGLIYSILGQYEKAQIYFQDSLQLSRATEDTEIYLLNLLNLGATSREISAYEDSILYFQEAITLAQSTESRSLEAEALNGLGSAFGDSGDIERAFEFHQQALDIAQENGFTDISARALGNLAFAHRLTGNLERAIFYREQSLELFRTLPESTSIINTVENRESLRLALFDLGGYYSFVNNPRKAREAYLEALALAQEEERYDSGIEIDLLNALSEVSLDLQEIDRAKDYAQQAVALAEKSNDRRQQSGALITLGSAYTKSAEYSSALSVLDQALLITREVNDVPAEAIVLGILGNVHFGLYDLELAADYFREALRLAQKIESPKLEWTNLNNLGALLFEMGDYQAAIDVLEEGVLIGKDRLSIVGERNLDRISLFDEIVHAYRSLERAYVAQGNYEQALKVSSLSRGRTLEGILQQAQDVGLPDEDFLFAEVDLEAIKKTAIENDVTLVQYSVVFDNLAIEGEDFRIFNAAYGIDSEVFIWVVQPSGQIHFRRVELPDQRTFDEDNDGIYYWLSSLIENHRNSLGTRSRATIIVEPVPGSDAQRQANQIENLQLLHQILIDPIAEWLPADANDQVIFIPHETLMFAPFAALADAEGIYLIEKHTIATAPSIQIFDLVSQQSAEKSGTFDNGVVVGNPFMPEVWSQIEGDFVKAQLGALPGAAEEARAIGNMLGITPLIQGQATEARIKQLLPSASLIHLATHGLLDYGDAETFGRLDVPGAVTLGYEQDSGQNGPFKPESLPSKSSNFETSLSHR